MENSIMSSPFCVQKELFNSNFIKGLGEVKKLKILGNYVLTKKDYDDLLVYTDVEELEVYDMENFDYQNEIQIILIKKIQFKSLQFRRLNLTKMEALKKEQLTLTLPFKLFFQDDTLYNEEDDFNKLISYTKNIQILNVNINDTRIEKVLDVISFIENSMGRRIQFINIITQNRTIDGIDKLKDLEFDRIVKVWYEDGVTDCTVDEFIVMRENIDRIVCKVKKLNLSNFEKVLYVYDIVKKFNYKKSSDNYSMDGRLLHKIFTTDSIVCSGYSKLISQVLNELGIQAGIYKLITKNNELHTRNIVHIKDDKYNINYIYSMEPTWESAFKEDYAYSLFLTPIDRLRECFPLERFRQDIDVLCGRKCFEDIRLIDKISLYQFFNNKDLTQQDITNFISQTNRLATLSDFCNALINVKVAQGFSKNVVELNIPKIINYNNQLSSYLNKEMKTNISFF